MATMERSESWDAVAGAVASRDGDVSLLGALCDFPETRRSGGAHPQCYSSFPGSSWRCPEGSQSAQWSLGEVFPLLS